MTAADKAKGFSRLFKLDSHHAIERFGIFAGVFAATGALVLGASGFSAHNAGAADLASKAQYTTGFTTSKTGLSGEVTGVYRSTDGDRALIMMDFDDSAKISYKASDYQAFLLGSDKELGTDEVSTAGVEGSLYVFGSTGYMGVLLDADQPFDKQILDLTMRSNAELNYDPAAETEEPVDPDDPTFSKYDQWQVYANPGASGATTIDALDSASFDPAKAYYDIVVAPEEKEARQALDDSLTAMDANLSQIEAYTADLQTTKVDGLFLKPPATPAFMAGDEITGEGGTKGEDDSTLALVTDHVMPSGFDFDWRSGNVYDGYFDSLTDPGQGYVEYLTQKAAESDEDDSVSYSQQISDMEWTLSNGEPLADYGSTSSTMRPLITVMNNLSAAYQDYGKNKQTYETTQLLDLLALDVDMRDVQSNTSTIADGFLTIFY